MQIRTLLGAMHADFQVIVKVPKLFPETMCHIRATGLQAERHKTDGLGAVYA